MKSVIAEFKSGIAQLLAFLDRTELEQELIARLYGRMGDLPAEESVLVSKVVETTTSAKQYIYAVAIVSLYGLLERLADGLVVSYVQHLNKFAAKYDMLPAVVQGNHLQSSLALANALAQDKYRLGITQSDVIGNLYSCLKGADDYKLNGAAYALHRGNLNLGRIGDMLSNVGVSQHARRLLRGPSVLSFLARQEPDRDFSRVSDADAQLILYPIDDLVERRNSVSHGVIRADNIESISILRERCGFVGAYGEGLFDILMQDLFRFLTSAGCATALGRPIKVFDNRIVCFDSAEKVAVGDLILAITGDELEPVRIGHVNSLEIDRVGYEVLEKASQPRKFGALVDFHARENIDYFVIGSDIAID